MATGGTRKQKLPTYTEPKAPKDSTYKSAYSGMINDLVNKAINREPFQYDPATDQAYQSYARQYTRLGDEASKNTLADVASQTGGLASSYAVTASQQARNEYNQALTDKIPALMEQAYAKYRDQYNDALAGINTLQGLDDSLYNRFATDRDYRRGVFESDRGFGRDIYESDRDYNESVRQYNQNYDLDKASAEFEKMLNTWSTLGYANKEIAKYFGVKEGTKTDDSAYKWAQFALDKARGSSGGGGGGGRRGRSGGYGSGYQSSEDKYGKYIDEESTMGDAYHNALHIGSQKINNGATDEQLENWLATVKGLSSDERDRLRYALGLKSKKNDYHKQAKDPYSGYILAYNK